MFLSSGLKTARTATAQIVDCPRAGTMLLFAIPQSGRALRGGRQ